MCHIQCTYLQLASSTHTRVKLFPLHIRIVIPLSLSNKDIKQARLLNIPYLNSLKM